MKAETCWELCHDDIVAQHPEFNLFHGFKQLLGCSLVFAVWDVLIFGER